MVFHSLNTGKARLTARFHPCLDNERPSLAIYIGIRRVWCRIFTIYPAFDFIIIDNQNANRLIITSVWYILSISSEWIETSKSQVKLIIYVRNLDCPVELENRLNFWDRLRHWMTFNIQMHDLPVWHLNLLKSLNICNDCRIPQQ